MSNASNNDSGILRPGSTHKYLTEYEVELIKESILFNIHEKLVPLETILQTLHKYGMNINDFIEQQRDYTDTLVSESAKALNEHAEEALAEIQANQEQMINDAEQRADSKIESALDSFSSEYLAVMDALIRETENEIETEILKSKTETKSYIDELYNGISETINTIENGYNAIEKSVKDIADDVVELPGIKQSVEVLSNGYDSLADLVSLLVDKIPGLEIGESKTCTVITGISFSITDGKLIAHLTKSNIKVNSTSDIDTISENVDICETISLAEAMN